MVRATYARVLVRLGGTYPAGFDATSVGNLCTSADYLLDGYTNPDTLSTTDNEVLELAVDVVISMMAEASWLQAGGYMSGKPKPEVFTTELKERIKKWMSGDYGPQAVDMISTSD